MDGPTDGRNSQKNMSQNPLLRLKSREEGVDSLRLGPAVSIPASVRTARGATPAKRAFPVDLLTEKRRVTNLRVRAIGGLIVRKWPTQSAVGHLLRAGLLRHHAELPLLRKLTRQRCQPARKDQPGRSRKQVDKPHTRLRENLPSRKAIARHKSAMKPRARRWRRLRIQWCAPVP